jgi:cell division protein FtsB
MKRSSFSWLRSTAVFAACLGLIAYMASDAIYGAHGLITKRRLEGKVARLNSELANLKQERAYLERDAKLLGDSVKQQPALLEEEARSLLDLAKPTDIVIVDEAQPSGR